MAVRLTPAGSWPLHVVPRTLPFQKSGIHKLLPRVSKVCAAGNWLDEHSLCPNRVVSWIWLFWDKSLLGLHGGRQWHDDCIAHVVYTFKFVKILSHRTLRRVIIIDNSFGVCLWDSDLFGKRWTVTMILISRVFASCSLQRHGWYRCTLKHTFGLNNSGDGLFCSGGVVRVLFWGFFMQA